MLEKIFICLIQPDDSIPSIKTILRLTCIFSSKFSLHFDFVNDVVYVKCYSRNMVKLMRKISLVFKYYENNIFCHIYPYT